MTLAGFSWADWFESYLVENRKHRFSHDKAHRSLPGSWIWDKATIHIGVSRQWIKNRLISLHDCTGWSVSLLFAYSINRFCQEVVHIIVCCSKTQDSHFERTFQESLLVKHIQPLCCVHLPVSVHSLWGWMVSSYCQFLDWTFLLTTHTMKCTTSRENVSSKIFDQVRFKPVCSGTEASKNTQTLDIASIHIILSKQRATKALIRLRRLICTFVVRIWHDTFMHDLAQIEHLY